MTENTSSHVKKTVSMSENHIVRSSQDENKEATTLIWFDPKIDSNEDTKLTMKQLRRINDYVIFHQELEACLLHIKSTKTEKILLITSGTRAVQLLPHITALQQIDSVFIFCMKPSRYQYLMSEYPKIVGIYTELDMLCTSIKEQINLIDKQLETFSFFDQAEKAIKDLSKESAEFLWYQLFTRIILRLPRHQQAKKQMLDMCRHYYRGNIEQQQLIDEFERTYKPEDAILWYSKDSFVYRLVNKALRCEDIDQLYAFRFFIGDLSESLARKQEDIIRLNEETLTVYRGTKLSRDEFEKLKENQGNLISTNGFLSTSRYYEVALAFATKISKRSDVESVIFKIKCDVQKLRNIVIFADIKEQSDFEDELEILFDLGAAFRIESVEHDGQLYHINMSVTPEAQAITHHYTEITRHETEERSVVIMFGRLMCQMGEYEKSQKYFEQLLNDPNGEDPAWIEFNIGRSLHYKGNWEAAEIYYNRAYHRMINTNSLRVEDSAYVLNSIGTVLQAQQEYNKALDFHRQALDIYEKHYSMDHLNVAYSLHSTGRVLHIQGKYDEALIVHRRALEIRRKHCDAEHPDIARSLNNIGNVLNDQRKYEQALQHCRQALEIRRKYCPVNHPDIAYSLNSIGNILGSLGKYEEALENLHQALNIRKNRYITGHPEIATSLSSIGDIFRAQEKYDEALDMYQQAVTIRERYHPNGHTEIALILNNIGIVYENRCLIEMALKFYQQALSMYEGNLSTEHPHYKQIEKNIRRLSSKI